MTTATAEPTVTVRCPQCTLEKVFDAAGIIPAEWKDADGNLLCPNCTIPMEPIGEAVVVAAEQAFEQAQQELAAEGKVEPTMPPGETVETLSKRLHEIESAHSRVVAAQDRYDTKHDAAKEAKKYLDNEIETFLTLAGRLSAVATPLPLFTAEAEQAAASSSADGPGPGEVHYTGLYERLVTVGYQAATLADLSTWTPEQRLEADTWAKDDQTEDGLPAFMRELADAISAAHGLKLEGPLATTPVHERPEFVDERTETERVEAEVGIDETPVTETELEDAAPRRRSRRQATV